MTKKAYYNLTHDNDGNIVLWIVATPVNNGAGRKPDLTVWARGFTMERLLSFAEYLKGSTICYNDFLLIEAKSGNTCRLADYMSKRSVQYEAH